MKRKLQHGQAMVEYIVIAGALLTAAIIPITPPPGLQCPLSEANNRCNVIQLLRASMQTEQAGFLYAASLPQQPGSQ
jgi:hypothetical protein